MPLEGNYVKLKVGLLDTMRFDMQKKVEKDVIDPLTKFPKRITTLEFHVIELNGETVSTVFSISSQVLMSRMQSFLDGDQYLSYRFTFTQTAGENEPPRLVSAQRI